MDLRKRASELTKTVPAVYLTMKDRETPIIAKLLAAVAVVYALSPIDLIPDFIPMIGYLDDILILPALIALVIKCIPREVWERNVAAAKDLWKDGKPKKWYYALPVILIWILILWLIVKILFF